MSADTPAKKPGTQMNRGQKAFVIVGVGGGLFLWIVAGMTPIPHGTENREKAQPFLKQQFPDRSVSPADSVTAPVAVVFELIRSGKPDEARRAIDFARDQQFGYAAPYVIERLGSGDPELERSALDFLRTISGRDYGQDADAWRAWWRDPPTNLIFMSIGPGKGDMLGTCYFLERGSRRFHWKSQNGTRPFKTLCLMTASLCRASGSIRDWQSYQRV